VSVTGRRNIADQIRHQIRLGIRDGAIGPSDKLPSSRELAARLSISRNTVTAAYDRLIAEGLLEPRSGVGVYVAPQPLVGPHAADPATTLAGPRPQSCWDELVTPVDLSANAPDLDLRAGFPSAAHFPYPVWRSMVSRQFRAAAVKPGAYGEPAGLDRLRAAIARHIAVSRGVRTSADEVFVTNGSQQAFDLVARTLLRPGDVVAVEDPGYPPVHMLFTSLGLRVVGVPVDPEGIVVSALPPDARLVYVTPSHQFPLGLTMSQERRSQLLAWAERADAMIIEDDYDTEFRYAGRPLDTLHSTDGARRVIYVGSFSKTMLPALRLGFLVSPPSLIPALRKAKLVADWGTSTPMQAALAQFIDEGHLARHIRRMRRIYEARHNLVVATLDQDFDALVERIPAYAGIHVAVLIPPGVAGSDTELARRARRAGLGLSPAISRFATTCPPRPGLMLGYGVIETSAIPEAMRRLRASFYDRPAPGSRDRAWSRPRVTR
jgi:GntR family transcriptional regulator / MocR family aminotransferase